MKIEIKLETADIEKMLSRIYGFKEGSVKVSINGNGEIIATADDFPVQSLNAPIYYGPGVRGITTTPDCTPLQTTLSGSPTGYTPISEVAKSMGFSHMPNSDDECSAADRIMERHFNKKGK